MVVLINEAECKAQNDKSIDNVVVFSCIDANEKWLCICEPKSGSIYLNIYKFAGPARQSTIWTFFQFAEIQI